LVLKAKSGVCKRGGDILETVVSESETERLRSLSLYEILDTGPEPAFDDLTALAADICHTPISLITFLDQTRQWVKSKTGFTQSELPGEEAFCAYTIRQKDVMVVPDATKDERFSNNPMVKGEPHIRYYAGYPLLSNTGHGLGALCVLDTVPHEIDPHELEQLRLLGHEVTQLLELRKEAHQTLHRTEELKNELERVQVDRAIEQKKHGIAEVNLKQRERQLADAQQLAELGSWEWDLKTNTVNWSDELYRVFGFAPGQFAATYEAYLAQVHPSQREQTNALIQSALKNNGTFFYEKRIIRPDGGERILYSSGRVILDEAKQPVRMVGFCQDITSRKEMEQKLEQSVALLNSTLNSTTDGILAVDLEGHLLTCNAVFLTMWHLPPDLKVQYDDELVLQRVLEQLSEPNEFLAKVREIYGCPETSSFDVLKFKDGRIYERSSKPQRVGKKIIGRVWSFHDVTEHARALKILRESEERYRSLVIATAQVVWTTDADGNLVEDNLGWRKLTGQTKAEMSGKGWLNALHPKDRVRESRTWAESVAQGAIYESEYRVRRVDGEWRYMRVRGVPVRNRDGKIREWIGFCLDVTSRKIAEKTILEERDFSHAIINSLPGIFYLLDENGLNLLWNKNLEKVTGYSTGEIQRMRASDFVPPGEKEFISERVRKVFSDGEADAEIHLLSKDGHCSPYYCTGNLIHLHGKPRLIGMGIDISSLQKAQREIRELNQQLESRVRERTAQLNSINKELESFSYTVSHDLKAPLRAISTYATVIQEDCGNRLDEEHRLYLTRIAKAAGHMSHLMEDLLNYSKIGPAAIHLQPIHLKTLIQQVANYFELEIKSVHARLNVQPDLPVVIADQTLLNQVFINLFENALTYRKQDVPLEISVTSREEESNVIVCVRDNGIGIEPVYHKKIFEVFRRLHSQESYPGTGIGLANVKKSMEVLGGSVWVESQLDEGSAFYVQLKKAV
jgi:PAS domain S-box-containing protein